MRNALHRGQLPGKRWFGVRRTDILRLIFRIFRCSVPEQPMDNDPSFLDLLKRVRLGDQDASSELVRLYENEVRRFIRYRLNSPRLRRFLDSLDVCQSVFAKFFVHMSDGDFDLRDPKQLQQLLLKMANNRLVDHCRKGAAKRRAGNETSLAAQTVDWVADNAAGPAEQIE